MPDGWIILCVEKIQRSFMMISKELLGYFDYSLNAIFTAENGKISYMNPSAKKLFPGVRVGDSTEVLGAESALHDRPGVFTAMIFDVP